MLKDLIKSGFGDKQDYNCGERMIYGANIAYNMGPDEKQLRLFAGYGGGMGVGEMCGAIDSACAIISWYFVLDHANEALEDGRKYIIKPKLKEYQERYAKKMDCYVATCSRLKELYRNPVDKCSKVIYGAAELLDEFLLEHADEMPNPELREQFLKAAKG